MIVAFLPPDVRTAKDDGSANAASHLQFAVDDTIKCLKPKTVRVKLVYADRLELRNGPESQVFVVRKLGQAVGAIVVEPGKKGRAVFSEVGPSTLQLLLPQAASEYWHTPSCAQ